jgi:hypothetical protein
MTDFEFDNYMKKYDLDRLAPEFRADGRRLLALLHRAYWAVMVSRRYSVIHPSTKNTENYKEALRSFYEFRSFVENNYIWGMMAS